MLALMQKRPRVRSLLEYYFFFLSLFFFGFFTSFLLFIPFAIYKRDVDLGNSAFYHALTTHPAVRRDVCGDHSPISSNYAWGVSGFGSGVGVGAEGGFSSLI